MDEDVYADPLAFRPERYMDAPEGNNEPYPPLVFGFGRRCVLCHINMGFTT